MNSDTYHDMNQEILDLKEHIKRKSNEISELHGIIHDLELELEKRANGTR